MPSNRAASPAAPAAISDVLGYLPIDSELVLGIDVKALRKTPLWAEYRPVLVAAMGRRLADLQQKCGFDPLETIDSVTVGLSGTSRPTGVVVVRGLDRDRTLACPAAAQLSAKITVEGGAILVASGGTFDIMAFVDRTTLVMHGAGAKTKEAAKAGHAAVLASGTPLRGSPAFLDLYGQLEPNATVWGAIRVRSGGFGQYASALGGEPRALFGTVRVAEGVAATLRLRMETADLAGQIATKVKGQLSAGALFGKFDATATGTDVIITAAMTADQIRSVAGMMKSILGDGDAP